MSYVGPLRPALGLGDAAMADRGSVPTTDTDAGTYVFLLLDQFTHLAFSCALEPLRLANHVSRRQLYRWEVRSLSGSPVQGSNGLSVIVDGGQRPLNRREKLVVVGGIMPRDRIDPALMAYLRRQSAHGVQIIGICGATSVLAAAGLVDDQPCAVHWELSEAFAQRHPEVQVIEGTFTLDGIATAAGGAAAADLMLHLIGGQHGSDLAGRVADQMIYSGIRGPQAPQTGSLQTRYGMRNRCLFAAMRAMEARLEEPLAMGAIARASGTSVRQLERLFQRHLNTTPARHYLGLRLGRAQKLVMQTDMSITDIALACGFTSPSHFSKKFRAHFGQTAQGYRLVRADVAA